MVTQSRRPPVYRFDTAGPLPTLIVGSGPIKAVSFHGLGWSPMTSLALLSVLARIYGLTIYAPWLPNHGAARDADCYEEFVAWINQWVHYYHIRQAPVIGHSIGGYIATEMSIRYPELASALVTMAA